MLRVRNVLVVLKNKANSAYADIYTLLWFVFHALYILSHLQITLPPCLFLHFSPQFGDAIFSTMHFTTYFSAR